MSILEDWENKRDLDPNEQITISVTKILDLIGTLGCDYTNGDLPWIGDEAFKTAVCEAIPIWSRPGLEQFESKYLTDLEETMGLSTQEDENEWPSGVSPAQVKRILKKLQILEAVPDE